ncbi:hypothetical protein B0H13DRAFT_2361671 [Mycena leptocephala]|nr:hypothetical protein B0H13DRAFT_2361671 [Mycena leptocephala]
MDSNVDPDCRSALSVLVSLYRVASSPQTPPQRRLARDLHPRLKCVSSYAKSRLIGAPLRLKRTSSGAMCESISVTRNPAPLAFWTFSTSGFPAAAGPYRSGQYSLSLCLEGSVPDIRSEELLTRYSQRIRVLPADTAITLDTFLDFPVSLGTPDSIFSHTRPIAAFGRASCLHRLSIKNIWNTSLQDLPWHQLCELHLEAIPAAEFYPILEQWFYALEPEGQVNLWTQTELELNVDVDAVMNLPSN